MSYLFVYLSYSQIQCSLVCSGMYLAQHIPCCVHRHAYKQLKTQTGSEFVLLQNTKTLLVFLIVIKQELNTCICTSTGSPISSVSYRTPPTAEPPIHGWFTLHTRKTWTVGACCHMFASCCTTPRSWLAGGSPLEGEAVSCFARCCQRQCWDHLWHLWAFVSRFGLISICRELQLRQWVG